MVILVIHYIYCVSYHLVLHITVKPVDHCLCILLLWCICYYPYMYILYQQIYSNSDTSIFFSFYHYIIYILFFCRLNIPTFCLFLVILRPTYYKVHIRQAGVLFISFVRTLCNYHCILHYGWQWPILTINTNSPRTHLLFIMTSIIRICDYWDYMCCMWRQPSLAMLFRPFEFFAANDLSVISLSIF